MKFTWNVLLLIATTITRSTFVSALLSPFAHIDFTVEQANSPTTYTLSAVAEAESSLKAAPGNVTQAFHVNNIPGQYAIAPDVNINPSIMAHCTLVIRLYIESAVCTTPNSGHCGFVVNHDNHGWDRSIVLRVSDIGYGLGMGLGWGPGGFSANTMPTFPDEKKWIQIAAVFRQGETNGSHMFLEGVKSPLSHTAQNNEGRNDLVIGALGPNMDYGSGNYWIKEVMVYDRALSDEEIISLNDSFQSEIQGGSITISSSPSLKPSLSLAPSSSPSVSMEPSIEPSLSRSPSSAPSDSTQPSMKPSLSDYPSSIPSDSVQPSIEPSLSAFPSQSPSEKSTLYLRHQFTFLHMKNFVDESPKILLSAPFTIDDLVVACFQNKDCKAFNSLGQYTTFDQTGLNEDDLPSLSSNLAAGVYIKSAPWKVSLNTDSISVQFSDDHSSNEMQLQLQVSRNNVKDLVSNIGIYDYDTCKSSVSTDYFTATADIASAFPDSTDLTYLQVPVDVDINLANVDTFSGFTNDNLGNTSTIKFCLKPELQTEIDEMMVTVSYAVLKFTVTINREKNLEVVNVTQYESDTFQDENSEFAYTVNACECSEMTGTCITDSEPYVQNTFLTLCISSSQADFVVESIKMMSLTQGAISYEAIKNGETNSLTSVIDSQESGEKVVITQLPSVLFSELDDETGSINIAGTAVMKFLDGSGRKLVRIRSATNHHQEESSVAGRKLVTDDNDEALGQFDVRVAITTSPVDSNDGTKFGTVPLVIATTVAILGVLF